MDVMKNKRAALVAAAGIASLVAAACGSASPGSSTGSTVSCPIIAGELMPMSGKEAFVGTWFQAGASAGLYAVNQAGGVLGCKMQAVLSDTAGDPVDAVPALHSLLLSSPAFIDGPSSLSILGVIKQFDPLKLPDLMQGGTTALDTMNYPYVWRFNTSDSQIVAGESYFALNKLNCTKAAFLFEDSANAQGEVPLLTSAFTGNGGTIVSNQKLEPTSTSYSSEVATAFAANPQCVFFFANATELSTLSAAVSQQGHMNVPFITEDIGASIDLANAFGLANASKWMYGTNSSGVASPAVTAFNAAYAADFKGAQPLNADASEAQYDSIIVAALAMSYAHSTSGAVWNADITKVTTNENGTVCYDYPSCLALIKQGSQIDYEGAATNLDFNKYHNVFSPESIVQFPASGGAFNVVETVSQSELASMYHG